MIHNGGRPQQLRKDRFQCICPDLICFHGGMEFVSCIHHSIAQHPFAVGQFVVDIQISNLLALRQLRQIAVDPLDDRSERHIVVPGKIPITTIVAAGAFS